MSATRLALSVALIAGCECEPCVASDPGPAVIVTIHDAVGHVVTDATVSCAGRTTTYFPMYDRYFCGDGPGDFEVQVAWRGMVLADRLVHVPSDGSPPMCGGRIPATIALTVPGTSDGGMSDATQIDGGH